MTKFSGTRFSRVALTSVAVLMVTITGNAVAETGPEELQRRIVEAIDAEQGVREKAATWADERAALIDHIREAGAERRWLEHQIKKHDAYIARRKDEIAVLRQKKADAAAVQRELEPFLDAAAARLAAFVAADLPFLTDERRKRLDSLNALLNDYDASLAEKTKRLFDAYQVEARYGYDFTRSDGEITVDGETLRVDLLRLGRVALFFRTPNGDKVGRYNAATGTWTLLPAKYGPEIEKGIVMAEKKRTPTLLNLPIERSDR